MEYIVAAYAPDKLNDPAQAEPVIQKMIAADPSDPAAHFQLMKIYEDAGRYEEAEQALLKGRDAKPNDPVVWNSIAAYYNRQGEFEKTMGPSKRPPSSTRTIRRATTRSAPTIRTRSRRTSGSPGQKKDYVMKGLAAEDKAISLNPNYMEAILWKNILLRQQANLETDAGSRRTDPAGGPAAQQGDGDSEGPAARPAAAAKAAPASNRLRQR